MREPQDDVCRIVSHPSALELSATPLFVVKAATSGGEKGGGPPASPRDARKTTRAKAPSAGAVPNIPAWPATPPSATA